MPTSLPNGHIGGSATVPNSNVLRGFKVGIQFAKKCRFSPARKRKAKSRVKVGMGVYCVGLKVGICPGVVEGAGEAGCGGVGGEETQMDGRETKANNFAPLHTYRRC